jgi:branched-chain amino acid transport system substrate-binding protein
MEGFMQKAGLRAALTAVAVAALTVGASAQTIKIGVVNTFSGPQASFGEMIDRAFRLYIKLNSSELPPGVKLEIINRDDGGANPDKARQLAQELVVRDKVDILSGITFTPNAMAIAPIATQAKIPTVLVNAGTSVVVTRSPYYVRSSFTIYQHCVPLGTWAAKTLKRTFILVSDYAPGHDCQEAYTSSYTKAGGEIVGVIRAPVATADFAPFLQRVKDAKPDAMMVFLPAGRTATAMMKGFVDLGLKSAGIKLIGTGDIVPEEELPNIGDEAIGTITMFHYSAAGDRPANKAFVAAWRKEYGEKATPNFAAAAAWDGMAMIFDAIKKQNGKLNPEKTVEIMSNFKTDNSPRGTISIDPETRDIVQNEYLRETRRVNGELQNVEIETVAIAIKDPWQIMQKEKK